MAQRREVKPRAGDEQYPAEVFAARIRAVLESPDCADSALGARAIETVATLSAATGRDAVALLANECAAHVERVCAAYNVDKAIRRAVACRLAAHVRISNYLSDGAMRDVGVILWSIGHIEENALAPNKRAAWPSNVSLDDVASVLGRAGTPESAMVLASIRNGFWRMVAPVMIGERSTIGDACIPILAPFSQGTTQPVNDAVAVAIGSVFGPQTAALVAWAEKDIEANRARPFIAVDAGGTHQFVLDAMAQNASAVTDVGGAVRRRGDVELRAPDVDDVRNGFVVMFDGPGMQLSLPLSGVGPDVIDGIRRAVGPEGPRHWAAILHLATQRGARSGRFVWTTDDHMRVMQYSADHMRDPNARAHVLDTVAALSRLELTVYRHGEQRIARRLLQPIERAEQRRPDGRWTVEGMTLELHPMVYSGVRDASGELGTNWFPASPDLPSLHHVNYPHALIAGLRLSQRLRWRFGDDGASFIDLSGENALALFGIATDRKHHKGRTWQTFDANVRALQGLPTPGVGKVEWLRGEHTLDGVVRLHAARWQVDRVHDGIRPVEVFAADAPTDGATLLTLRKRQNLTQSELAGVLRTTARTVRRFEASAAGPLPQWARDRLEEWLRAATVRRLESGG